MLLQLHRGTLSRHSKDGTLYLTSCSEAWKRKRPRYMRIILNTGRLMEKANRIVNPGCVLLHGHQLNLPFLPLTTQTQVSQIMFNMCSYAHSLPAPSVSPAVVDEQQISRNVQALKNRLRGRGGRRGGKAASRTESGSGRESHPGSECVYSLFFIAIDKIHLTIFSATVQIPLPDASRRGKLNERGETRPPPTWTWLHWISVTTSLVMWTAL